MQDKKIKVFFLEDEDTIREVLIEYMMVAGFQVTGVADGDEALKVLSEGKFDVGVFDIMVPGPSGLEVLDSIRKSGNNMPVIMLTALEDEKTQIQAFNSLADDFISKPVSPIILIKRLESVLRRASFRTDSKNSEENKSSNAGLIIEKGSYSAYFNEKNLNLTVSEFLILETLKSRPGMIYSRDQLINIVFNEDYITSPRIIDTHIKNLRKKLPVNCIKTVIGVGYKYEEDENESD